MSLHLSRYYHKTIISSIYSSLVAQVVKHLPAMWETRVQSLGWEDPLEKEMATQSIFLPGKSHEQRSLVDYSPWGRKESDTTERLHFHSLKNPFIFPKSHLFSYKCPLSPNPLLRSCFHTSAFLHLSFVY